MNCLSLRQQVIKTISVTVGMLVLCAGTEMEETGRLQQFHRMGLKAPELESDSRHQTFQRLKKPLLS